MKFLLEAGEVESKRTCKWKKRLAEFGRMFGHAFAVIEV